MFVITAQLPLAPWAREAEGDERTTVSLSLPGDRWALAAASDGGTQYRQIRELRAGEWFRPLHTDVTLTILDITEDLD